LKTALQGSILVIGTMSDRNKSTEELEAEMDALTRRLSSLGIELQEAHRRQRAEPPTEACLTEREQYKALLRKMVGRRVLITVKGPHQGKEGVITRHAGDTFHPVNWYVTLPDGSETRKNKHSFKLLPRQGASSEEA